jgi:signal transduction histidine kinase/ligand-binding sensor domain-containing protein
MIDGSVRVVKGLEGQTINAMIEPENGRIVIASEQGMVFDCRAKADGGVEVKPLLTQPLESADRDRPGPLPLTSLTFAHDKLFAGSLSRGLLAIENGAARELQARRLAFFIYALETDRRGQLWVGTKSRKDEPSLHSSKDLAQFATSDEVTGAVMAVQSGHSDDIWVGTDGRGVFYFPASRKPVRLTFDGTAGGLRSDHVFAIFVDREDVVWFGTDRGVSRYDPNAPRVENIGDSAESNFVRTIYQASSGQLLAGTNRGLFVYDQSASRWNLVNGLARNIIYCLAQDNSGRLLVGSAGGFYVGPALSSSTQLESETFSRLEASSGTADAVGSIRAIAPFRGSIYIASYGRGLERLEGNRLTSIWPNDPAITSEVISLCPDGDKRLLVGTARDGVVIFDGQQVRPDPEFEKLSGGTVRSIEATRDPAGGQTLWFATNRGVYLCRSNTECVLAAPGYNARSLTKVPGKAQNEVWCATTGSGLLLIDLHDQLGPIVSQLDAEQGLPSQNVFAALAQNSSEGDQLLLVGTSRGIARYRPGTHPPTLYASRVISKRVHAIPELATGLYLDYPQNSLLLDVWVISSRTFPEQFQYAFTLTNANGVEIKKKLARDSQFVMEGLTPGKYRVTARAFTKDLVSSGPLSFEFTIARAPFPWTSTALAILLALALLALFWAIQERRRIARTSAALVAANRELAGARFNLANEAERERRRIARDLHDQTLADLRHLLLLSDQLPANGAAGSKQLDPALLRTEIESISQEVRRICEDLSPSVLQNVGFAAALEFALSHAVEDAPADKRFEYEFVCDEALEEHAQLPANVQMQIYRLVQEAVSNIWRHAGATNVKMTVAASPDGDFLLQLQDNGREFDPREQQNLAGRGLANMRARASLIDAEISWEKLAGGGTLFILQLKRAAAGRPS